MPADHDAPRWYSKGAGRWARALLGLPLAAGAVWLFVRGGTLSTIGGVLLALPAVSLPLAAIFQEPD